jgi:hypothetical protein
MEACLPTKIARRANEEQDQAGAGIRVIRAILGGAIMKSIAKLLLCGSTGIWILGVAASVALLAAPAEASISISSAATKNMNCSAGVCSPTKTTAVLNVSDLKRMLKSGNVTVTTTGSGSVQANNIVVATALTWSSSNGLTLAANQSIAFDAPVSVTGKGGLTLSDAGTESLAFYNGANITFAKLSSSLVINGNSYVLVDSVAGFADAISNNQNGDFALAANYDASGDGTYSSAPVQGDNATGGINGIFEGLGNTIINLTIVDGTGSAGCDGLISTIGNPTISNFGMVNVSITSTGDQGANGAGGITCNAGGLIWRSNATGTITMGRLDGAGGLATGGVNGGLNIVQSWANVAISGTQGDSFGGLSLGGPGSVIQKSFSMGPLSCSGQDCQLGGLALNGALISDSYSDGAVSDTSTGGGDDAYIGGLLSQNGGGTIERAYAAGEITSPSSGGCGVSTNCVGGLYGVEDGSNNHHVYWDKTTTGYDVAAGNESSDPGTKGLTNNQLKAQLPKGFNKKIWAESPSINNGLPYLIANPPPN